MAFTDDRHMDQANRRNDLRTWLGLPLTTEHGVGFQFALPSLAKLDERPNRRRWILRVRARPVRATVLTPVI